MRTISQATKLVAAIGGTQLLVEDKEGKLKPGRRVDITGLDFDLVEPEISKITTLYKVVSGDRQSPWVNMGYKFEVAWPKEKERCSLIRGHFGARRKAKNAALAFIKEDMDAKKKNPEYKSTPWNLAELRKRWNENKDTIAPWWSEYSKCAYASGIDDLVDGLTNWRKSKTGERAGRKANFPKFESKKQGKNRIRFDTGTMRLESDRRGITLPVIGTLKSKENTRRLQRRVAKGDAKILNMTLSEHAGRLFISVQVSIKRKPIKAPKYPNARAGVDSGVRVLMTVSDSFGNTFEVPNPTPLRNAQSRLRREQRKMSRRIKGSRGWEQSKAKIAKIHKEIADIRKDSVHKATSLLLEFYGTIIIEDLNISGMCQGLNRRFRRAVYDAAMGNIKPMLTYKKENTGTTLVLADRWFPSSQIHHGCGCKLEDPKPSFINGKPVKLSKMLACQVTNELVDRDINASLNLRDYELYEFGSVGALAVFGNSAQKKIHAASVENSESACKTGNAVSVASAVRDEVRSRLVRNQLTTPVRSAK